MKTKNQIRQRQLAAAVSNGNKNVSPFETIDAIEKAGFKNVFKWYNRTWNPSQEEQLKYIREKGLNVIFAHLGYDNIDDLWLEGESGDRLLSRYKDDIKVCKENFIPMVIMHLTDKSAAPMYNETGLKRLRELVDYAETLNIKVAFENTKLKGYLEYVIENIHSKNAGVCFDSGHYHLYFDDEFDFNRFKDRIFAVHLHDNDKKDDLHLIPFDGTLDWKAVVTRLKNSGYSGPITVEPCYRNGYLNMEVEEFYKRTYEAGERLREMFEGLE